MKIHTRTLKLILTETKRNHKQNQEPLEQPRRLSLRRPSNVKREVVESERFQDICLKPVLKEKEEPQHADKDSSKLTKVKSENASPIKKKIIFIERNC